MGVLKSRSAGTLHVLVATIVLASVACNVESQVDSQFGPQDTFEGDSSLRDVGSDAPAEVVRTFDGTWLHFSQFSSCISLATIIEEGINRALFIVEADYDETSHRVNETWQACYMELPEVFDQQTFATEALYETSYPVTSTNGIVTSTQVGGGYVSGPLAELWGWETEEPFTDDFPVDVDTDSRIFDSDGDGNPGATILVGDQCETYIIQRALTTWQGTFVAPDRIEGSLTQYTRQETVGASSGFCGTSYETVANDVRNTFTRYRIDGRGNSLNLDENGDGEITCDEVVDLVDVLFTRITEDDANCE